MMNLCQCLQNNVVNSKLTCLIYSSLEALLNINVIATLDLNSGCDSTGATGTVALTTTAEDNDSNIINDLDCFIIND